MVLALRRPVKLRDSKPTAHLKHKEQFPTAEFPFSLHSRFQLDAVTGNHEVATSEMVEGARMLCLAIHPSLDDLEDEQTVAAHHSRVRHNALQVGKAFYEERCRD